MGAYERCHFCGDELDHLSKEDVAKHYEECRPDLFPHEIGPKCTWPGDRCYWDHLNPNGGILSHMRSLTERPESRELPIHRTEAGYPNCATCDGGGCLDCTDPA